MPKARQTPHRSTEAQNHDLRKLRGDNNALKKQVGRLRKQLERAAIPEVLDDDAVPTPTPPKSQVSICECDAPDVVVVKLPTGTMAGCKGCGVRRKV